MSEPVLYMIAGPNGAGKTTAAMKLLPDFLNVHEFVNADEIARGLNPLNPQGQVITAGKIMLQRLDDLIAARKSFAFESTGAGHIFAEKMQTAKAAGYKIRLIYLWLPNVKYALQRVQMRVAQGGHNIPEQNIERRYYRSLINLVKVYLPLSDDATIIDATFEGINNGNEVNILAQKNVAGWIVYQETMWHNIETLAGKKFHDNA